MAQTLDAPTHHWACPNCPATDLTQKAEPHTQFHMCPGTYNLTIPLVEIPTPGATPDARHVAVMHDQIPSKIAAVRTERGDGSNDCTVFP